METPPTDPLRTEIGKLLPATHAQDGLARYYALYHNPSRTELFVAADGAAKGFLVRARTGQDLFRPLVTLRAANRETASNLLTQSLLVGRPYYLTVPEALSGLVLPFVQSSDLESLQLYQLDPARFAPQINVMVLHSRTAEGWPRAQILSGEQVYSTAGINWMTEKFAELYVFTEPAARGKGWGRAVVNALVNQVLQMGRTPVYAVDTQNAASIHLAETVGFVDTGHRELACNVFRNEEQP